MVIRTKKEKNSRVRDVTGGAGCSGKASGVTCEQRIVKWECTMQIRKNAAGRG